MESASLRLNLFFTQNVSLQNWHETGLLVREVALYKRLTERDVAVNFVTYGKKEDHSFSEQLGEINVISNDLNLPPRLYVRQLERIPPKGDVFKSNQIAGADIALASALRAKAKFVVRCGYLLSEFQEQKYGIKSKEAREAGNLERQVFSKADAKVVTTEAMAEAVRSRYSVSEGLNVIPNYVETERFKPSGEKKQGKFRVGFVGRLDKQKNLPPLIDAMQGLDAELALVGYGPLGEELARQTTELGVEAKFLGKKPSAELPEFLNSCDVFVLPSLYEGHPKALLEAMACGLPVIGTKVPGIREVITHNVNGLLCEPNSEALRTAIESLQRDPELAQRLGEAARMEIEIKFSLDRIANKELNLLKSLVA